MHVGRSHSLDLGESSSGGGGGGGGQDGVPRRGRSLDSTPAGSLRRSPTAGPSWAGVSVDVTTCPTTTPELRVSPTPPDPPLPQQQQQQQINNPQSAPPPHHHHHTPPPPPPSSSSHSGGIVLQRQDPIDDSSSLLHMPYATLMEEEQENDV
ncbi:hypothetical protein Pcinc_028792 [Petrolisthes cinctipes]|uniref:Uncharacterized protein n=1 Tax=Petrolisthes cinctipes TaxID=88211 RepID=A0AAE1F1A9_PETCI|nr:hypothetical protein Pcinc_028792 [Petrolisthes cinctipes]